MILEKNEIATVRAALEEYLHQAVVSGADCRYPAAYQLVLDTLAKFQTIKGKEIVIFDHDQINSSVAGN
jgi:hypothetical protein